MIMQKKKILTDEQQADAVRLKSLYNAKKKSLGINHDTIADVLEVSQGAISHYLNGINPLNPKAATAFAQALQVSVAEFSPSIAREMTQMALAATPGEASVDEVQAIPKSNTYKVSVLDLDASAGYGSIKSKEVIDIIKSIEYATEEAKTMFSGRPARHVKVVNVRGDSMSPTIESGDLIFVDITINHFDGDGLYVFCFDEIIYVKRLQMVKGELLVLSDNTNYRDWDIKPDDFYKLHVAGKVLLSQSQAYKRHG